MSFKHFKLIILVRNRLILLSSFSVSNGPPMLTNVIALFHMD